MRGRLSGHYDGDGYSDLQEYLNWRNGETDPMDNDYNPKIKNVPNCTGYEKCSSILFMALPAFIHGSL